LQTISRRRMYSAEQRNFLESHCGRFVGEVLHCKPTRHSIRHRSGDHDTLHWSRETDANEQIVQTLLQVRLIRRWRSSDEQIEEHLILGWKLCHMLLNTA